MRTKFVLALALVALSWCAPVLAQAPGFIQQYNAVCDPKSPTHCAAPDASGGQPLGASENHLGEIGGNQITVTVAQTVTASSAYTSGNAVGGLITFAGAARVSGVAGAVGTSGLLQSALINAKSAQTTQMDLVLFSANPTGSTCTDKTAFAVVAADFDKVLGVAHVTDWTSLGTPSAGQSQNLAMPYALASSTSLYGCLVTRSTPTFTATTDISVSVRLLRQ